LQLQPKNCTVPPTMPDDSTSQAEKVKLKIQSKSKEKVYKMTIRLIYY